MDKRKSKSGEKWRQLIYIDTGQYYHWGRTVIILKGRDYLLIAFTMGELIVLLFRFLEWTQ